MAKNVSEAHQLWLRTPGKKGQPHNDNSVRAVYLPPKKSITGWSIKRYLNRWDLVEQKLA